MRRLIYILTLLIIVINSSCSLDTFDQYNKSDFNSCLQVIGVVTSYDEKNVDTKADAAVEVQEMTMYIFGSDDSLIGEPINVKGNMPTFVIDTHDNDEEGTLGSADEYEQVTYTKDLATMSACKIYIVANAWYALKDETIRNLSDLNSINLPVPNAGIPSTGIPMIGTHASSVTFDLCDASNNNNTIATIPLIKLYSKVNVRIQVTSNQLDDIPSFELNSWKVCNIPSKVRIGEYNGATIDNITQGLEYFDGTSTTEITGGAKNVFDVSSQPSSYVQFTCYVPEHNVEKNNFPYPDGISESDKQRYKPKFLGSNKAPFVEFEGIYTDHQSKQKQMIYRIYLGQNNIDDFNVIRNQELNNIVSIRGADKSSSFSDIGNRDNTDNSNISVDYRVESELTGNTHFTYYIERETMLDSHIEVRPLVLEFADNSSGSVKIDLTNRTVPAGGDGEDETWIGIRADRQDYFVPSLTASNSASSLVVKAQPGQFVTVWLYFDDNISIKDRTGAFTLTYCSDNQGNQPTAESYTVGVKQYGLVEVEIFKDHKELKIKDGWLGDLGAEKITVPYVGSVTGGTHNHYLYIERVEEYLNYFDPLDDPATEMKYNGLEWGANNVEIGDKGYNNYHEGDKFTKTIITKANTSLNGDPTIISTKLYEKPDNAAAYCYLKNKRSDTYSGSIPKMSTNAIWYLPGIRELEQILATQFTKYKEFQENFYWSSACAKNSIGREEKTYARASKAYIFTVPDGNDYNKEFAGKTYFRFYESSNSNEFTNHNGTGGYTPRKDKLLRIRAAYKKTDGSRIID